MNRILYVAAAGLFWAVSSAHAAPFFATTIVDSTPAFYVDTDVLGAPDGSFTDFMPDSTGAPGFVVVEFGGPVVDLSGDDFIIHLIDWAEPDEEFRVLASDGGAIFSLVGESGPPRGGPFPASHTIGFDLASAGLQSARFVRIENLFAIDAQSGPDIDAVEGRRAAVAHAISVEFDFSNGIGDAFSVVNEGNLWVIDDAQSRIRISKSADPGDLDSSFEDPTFTQGGLVSRFELEGDFSVTVDFELHDFPLPLVSRSLTESILGVTTADSLRFTWILRFNQSDGSFREIFAEPPGVPLGVLSSNQAAGRYRLQRIGDQISGSVAALGSNAFSLLATVAGEQGPLRIELLGRQGVSQPTGSTSPLTGPRTAMDISFDNLIVEADVIRVVDEPITILELDFSGQDTNAPLQSGYVGWAGPEVGNPGSSYDETRTFSSIAGTSGTVEVNVRSDGLFFRDYSPITAGPFVGLSSLLSDNINRNRPGSIFLTFSGLLDGVYGMTSFHHDTNLGATFIPFDIIVSDGLASSQTLLSGLDTTHGTTPSAITTADYSFTVIDGGSATVEFAGQAQNAQHMSINGFQIKRTGDVVADPEDLDGDGVVNSSDNCPSIGNQDQRDSDADNIGDVCDDDKDGDGVANSSDNCPSIGNQDQRDSDADNIGDVCDDDKDGDGVPNDYEIANGLDETINDAHLDRDGDGATNGGEYRYGSLAGDANSVPPTVGLILLSGLNLIGAPTLSRTIHVSAFQFLEDVGGSEVIASVQRFNRVAGRFETASYEGGVATGVDFPLEAGYGYALYMLQGLSGFTP